jgi:hypothetical protein
VAIAALLVVIASSAIATVVWASTYQPLRTGALGLNPQPSHQDALQETVATFRDAEPFQFGFSVRNDGKFSVRVLDIPMLHDGTVLPFAVRAFVSAEPLHWTGGSVLGRLVLFQPFDLRPGEERMLEFRGRYANCREFASSSEVIYDAFDLHARFLAWTHTVRIHFSEPLVIRFPRSLSC